MSLPCTFPHGRFTLHFTQQPLDLTNCSPVHMAFNTMGLLWEVACLLLPLSTLGKWDSRTKMVPKSPAAYLACLPQISILSIGLCLTWGNQHQAHDLVPSPTLSPVPKSVSVVSCLQFGEQRVFLVPLSLIPYGPRSSVLVLFAADVVLLSAIFLLPHTGLSYLLLEMLPNLLPAGCLPISTHTCL